MTTRATAAILQAVEALDSAEVGYEMTTMYGGGECAVIIFEKSWRQLGFCYLCGHELEDRRRKECDKCRNAT